MYRERVTSSTHCSIKRRVCGFRGAVFVPQYVQSHGALLTMYIPGYIHVHIITTASCPIEYNAVIVCLCSEGC